MGVLLPIAGVSINIWLLIAIGGVVGLLSGLLGVGGGFRAGGTGGGTRTTTGGGAAGGAAGAP
jgi:hypothetical protein